MSNYRRALVKAREREIIRNDKITLRKHLNADALFAGIPEYPGNAEIA